MTRFIKLRDLLSRDPLRAAAEALAAGDRGRAMELLARGGDWHRAAQLAAEMGEDEKLVRYSLMAAFGRLPEGASLEPLRAAELLASRGHHKEAIPLFERARAFLQAGESALVLRQTLRAARHFKQAGAWMQVVRCYEEAGKLRRVQRAIHLGELLFCDGAQLDPQPCDSWIGDAVADHGATSFTRDQTGALEALEMLGSVRDAECAGLGQLLHAARRLHQQIQQLQPMRVGCRLCNLRDYSIQSGFCCSVMRHIYPSNTQ